MRTGVLVFALLMLTAGCAERYVIATAPPGAEVLMDGAVVGETPYYATVPRGQLHPVPYEVKLDGFRSEHGTLEVRVAPGRVVGAVFTLGILYIFRSPYYIESVHHVLKWDRRAAGGVGPTGSQKRLEDRLEKLKQLRDDGLLTDKELQDARDRIIRGDN